MITESNCTIIVNSCDAYSDTWQFFFSALQKNWSECNLPIVLNTEKITRIEFGSVKNLTIHNYSSADNLWGKRLRKTLDDISTEFVIMLYDDFLLEEQVDTDLIDKCRGWLSENKDISVFYFYPIQGKSNIRDENFEFFEKVGPDTDYKLNSAPAIWRKDDLYSLTGDIDTPWAWEFFGSHKANQSNAVFYALKEGAKTPYTYNFSRGGAIYRGKWVEEVVSPMIDMYKVPIDLNLRGIYKVGQIEKRSLQWKILFFLLGFRMIGLSAFKYMLQIIARKIGFRI